MIMNVVISFFTEYGMFIYNTITIVLSIFALYQLYVAQPKRDKYRQLLNEIIQTLLSLESMCTQLWCNEGLINKKSYIMDIKNKFRQIGTNLTIIDKQYKKKVKNIMDFVIMHNTIKDKATGGDFESIDFKTDINRAEEISTLIANFSKEIKML